MTKILYDFLENKHNFDFSVRLYVHFVLFIFPFPRLSHYVSIPLRRRASGPRTVILLPLIDREISPDRYFIMIKG